MTPKKLKELRLKHKYSQHKLGLKIGVSGSYYGRMERGEVKPHNKYLVQLARIYGLDESPYKEVKHVLRTPEERKQDRLQRKHYLDKLAKKYGTDGVLGNFDSVDKTDSDWVEYCKLVGGKVSE